MNKVFTVMAAAAALVVAWGLIISLPVMLLWNWCLVPAVPLLDEIGWLQAWGIYLLFALLFKSSAEVKPD